MKSGNVKSIVMKSVGCLRLLCLIGLTATTVLNAEIPPYFSILADNYVLPGETWRPGTMSDCGWSPSREDEAAGFACGLGDVELAPKMDWIWPETAPRRIFRFIGLRGEIRAQ